MTLKIKDIETAFLISGIDKPTIDIFINWLKENREVWKAFEAYALQAMSSGRQLGAKAICERVRWYCEIEKGQDYKVNNNFTAYLARLFMIKHNNEYFETRECKGLKEAA